MICTTSVTSRSEESRTQERRSIDPPSTRVIRVRTAITLRAVLSFDGDPVRDDRRCERCGVPYRLLKTFVLSDGSAHAICYVALHRHDGEREAWFDVIFGTWEDDAADHVTFGCRVGPVKGQVEPAATLVEAAIPYSDDALFGRKLTRDEALGDARLDEFWGVVDFVLEADAEVEHHVYHDRG
jgi:hypothetical protein